MFVRGIRVFSVKSVFWSTHGQYDRKWNMSELWSTRSKFLTLAVNFTLSPHTSAAVEDYSSEPSCVIQCKAMKMPFAYENL